MMHCTSRARPFMALGTSAIFAAVFLAGCSAVDAGPAPASTPGAVGTPETPDLTVSAYAISAAAPLYIGIDEGIFESYGLNVEPSQITTIADGAAALQSGDSQMYYTNLFGVVNAVNAGIDLRIVTEVIAASPVVQTLEVMPDSDIEDVLDLDGKKVGLVAVNSSLDATLNASMANAGGDFATIEYVQIPYADIPAALEQGTIDAGILTGPPLTIAKDELDTRTVWDAGGGEYEGLSQVSYVTSREFAESNPTTIANYQCAYAKSTDLYWEGRDIYLSATAPRLGITEEQLDAQTDFNLIHGFRPDKLTQISEIMEAGGLIAEPFDLNALTIPFPETCD